MGNKDSKPATSLVDWEKVDTDNGIDIYKNKKSNELAEKRAVTIDPHYDLNDQLKIYHMREHNRDALVRAFGTENIQKNTSSDGICSGHKKVFVLTQKMPYRLSELPQLTFPQSLLFLRQSLRAYSKVFKNYGPIHVTKQLIGVNDYGQVKCWVNQNWALNHPDHDFPSLQTTKLQDLTKEQFMAYGAKYRDQTQIVHNITAVIQQKCEQGKFPKAFSEEVELHSSSFKKLELYLQDFITYNQIFIPPKINYETVFVSKYQARLAQQHQLSGQHSQQYNGSQMQGGQLQSGQNIQQNQQIINQNRSQTSQNGGYIGHQGIQQSVNYGYGLEDQYSSQGQYQGTNGFSSATLGQNIGYSTQNVSTNNYQSGLPGKNQVIFNKPSVTGPQQNLASGYTVTKTTTTSNYGGLGGITNNISGGNIEQNASYSLNSHTANNNLPISTNVPITTSLWSNTESVYKPVESTHQYSTTYNNYSSSNQGATVPAGNYNFGGILGGKQTSSTYETYKPSTYTSVSNNNGLNSSVSHTYSTSTNNNYGISTNNLYGTSSNLGYNHSVGGLVTQNVITPYSKSSTYQETIQRNIPVGDKHKENTTFAIGGTNTHSQVGNYSSSGVSGAGYTGAGSAAKYTTYTTSYNTGNVEPSYAYSGEKGSTYSFDGKQDFSSKFGGYSGSGYSNTLTKYDTITTTKNGPSELNNLNIEGKYSDAFNSLISPSLRGNLQQGQSNGGYTVITTQKRQSSNIPISSRVSQTNNQTNILEGFAKMVQRSSNQVGESAIKQF